MTMTTRPRMTGRAPLSPLRTRESQILAYSPREFAMTSGAARATSAATSSWSAASGAGPWTSVLTGAPWLLGRNGVTCNSVTGNSATRNSATRNAGTWNGGEALRGTGGHQVDDGLGVVLRGRPVRDQTAQAQHGDPVRDRLDVVQVVRNDDHRDVLALQPFDQVEHDAGLGHAEGRGRLVQDHQLSLAHHGPGHRDRLPLAAGQRADRLADRADRHHRQIGQRLLGGLLHPDLVQLEVLDLLAAEKHVRHDVQIVAQGQVLVDGGDAEIAGILRGVQVDLAALPEDLAVVLLIDAG